eukprot:CAMPEP_0172887454 /NCGR_PEP_ID=MMETSP1075-20121228/133990_1 /TAXON_ID=2916 /ORGANISM="Ceratium fusus, Strain PA161109" /LENGTH=174 /DNA_ID=CAMNT_0013741147 /DNA_START=62 /DNA_END=586 /DNA_ORIENTATION=-
MTRMYVGVQRGLLSPLPHPTNPSAVAFATTATPNLLGTCLMPPVVDAVVIVVTNAMVVIINTNTNKTVVNNGRGTLHSATRQLACRISFSVEAGWWHAADRLTAGLPHLAPVRMLDMAVVLTVEIVLTGVVLPPIMLEGPPSQRAPSIYAHMQACTFPDAQCPTPVSSQDAGIS